MPKKSGKSNDMRSAMDDMMKKGGTSKEGPDRGVKVAKRKPKKKK